MQVESASASFRCLIRSLSASASRRAAAILSGMSLSLEFIEQDESWEARSRDESKEPGSQEGRGEVKRNRGGISRAVDKEETGQKEKKKKKKSEREKERKGNRKMEVPDLQDQFFAPEPTLGYSKPTF